MVFFQVCDLVTCDVSDEVGREIDQLEVEVQISIWRAATPPSFWFPYGYSFEFHSQLFAIVGNCWFEFVEELSLQNPFEPSEVVPAVWVELNNFFVEVDLQRPVFTELEVLPQYEKTSGVFHFMRLLANLVCSDLGFSIESTIKLEEKICGLMIKVISFDLDGTLIDWTFAESLWFDGISRLYAERWGLNPEKARQEITRRYDKVGMGRLEWYDIKYWWKEFGLSGSCMDLVEQCRSNVRTYPEVHEVLEKLHRRFKLMVITNGARELAEVEIEQVGLKDYIDWMFSATSDFGLVKKTGEFYSKVLKAVGVSPAEVAHVGDNWIFDYLAPREAGIKAFFLDRDGKQSGEFVVRDLREFSCPLL